MKKITTLISIAWLICQLPTSKLKALKQGELVKVKGYTVQVWALENKDIIIIKTEKDDGEK